MDSGVTNEKQLLDQYFSGKFKGKNPKIALRNMCEQLGIEVPKDLE